MARVGALFALLLFAILAGLSLGLAGCASRPGDINALLDRLEAERVKSLSALLPAEGGLLERGEAGR